MKKLIIFKLYLIPTLFILPLIANAQNSKECFPPCRTGYFCHEGNCISKCNPPCPSNQKCNDEGECIEVDSSLTKTPSDKTNTVKKIVCDSVFIVRPELEASVVVGNFNEAELMNASNLIANAIVSKINFSSTIISNNELSLVKNCQAKLIVCKIKSYIKEPARMNQYEGTVTVIIETYNSINDLKPIKIEEFSAKGERHWGESIPLENAFTAVSKKIKKGYTTKPHF